MANSIVQWALQIANEYGTMCEYEPYRKWANNTITNPVDWREEFRIWFKQQKTTTGSIIADTCVIFCCIFKRLGDFATFSTIRWVVKGFRWQLLWVSLVPCICYSIEMHCHQNDTQINRDTEKSQTNESKWFLLLAIICRVRLRIQ